MFSLFENAVEFIANIDYQVLAIKAVVKAVEVGIDVVTWSLNKEVQIWIYGQ